MHSKRQGPVPMSIVSVRLPTCLANEAPLGEGRVPRPASGRHQLPAPSAFFGRRCSLISKRRRPRAASATLSTCPDGFTPVALLALVKVPTSKRPSCVSTIRPVVSSTISSPSLWSAILLCGAALAPRFFVENALLAAAAALRCDVPGGLAWMDATLVGSGGALAACRTREPPKSGFFHLLARPASASTTLAQLFCTARFLITHCAKVACEELTVSLSRPQAFRRDLSQNRCFTVLQR